LYKWQLTVEKYEDPTDYNWDAIEQLLKSDTYKVAVNILKNKNLELYKEDLIMFIIDNFNKLIRIPGWMSFVRRHLFSKDIILEKALHKAYLFNREVDINYLLNKLRTNNAIKLNMDKILTKYDYNKDFNRFIHKSVNSLASV
jgi:hypothetical protein